MCLEHLCKQAVGVVLLVHDNTTGDKNDIDTANEGINEYLAGSKVPVCFWHLTRILALNPDTV